MEAYILLRSGSVNLPPLALRSQSSNIPGQVQRWTLLVEGRRRIGRWPGHVEVADLGGTAGEIAQGNELCCSRCGHCGGGIGSEMRGQLLFSSIFRALQR